MSNFDFRHDPINRSWVVIAPKRSKRPDASHEKVVCPFCSGNEKMTPPELFRIGKGKSNKPGWEIRVTPNKFPFAPVHEIVVHSNNHEENFFTFSLSKLNKIFSVYKKRYLEHKNKGQVLIFHNFGKEGAESLTHSHTQITVAPTDVSLEIPVMGRVDNIFRQTKYFQAFCPSTSHWPFEVWIAPKERGEDFGAITNNEVIDLGKNLKNILRKLSKNLGKNFPFNFYIYPGSDWYFRIIPRQKILGGFELATNVFVNTSDPASVAKKLS